MILYYCEVCGWLFPPAGGFVKECSNCCAKNRVAYVSGTEKELREFCKENNLDGWRDRFGYA